MIVHMMAKRPESETSRQLQRVLIVYILVGLLGLGLLVVGILKLGQSAPSSRPTRVGPQPYVPFARFPPPNGTRPLNYITNFFPAGSLMNATVSSFDFTSPLCGLRQTQNSSQAIEIRRRRRSDRLLEAASQPSGPGEHPWALVLIRIYYRYRLVFGYANSDIFCGATLVAPHWAVTAAHCLRGVDLFAGTVDEFSQQIYTGSSATYTIVAANHLRKWKMYSRSLPPHARPIRRTITHPSFVTLEGHDIGLIQWLEPFELSQTETLVSGERVVIINSACLPPPRAADLRGVTSGFELAGFGAVGPSYDHQSFYLRWSTFGGLVHGGGSPAGNGCLEPWIYWLRYCRSPRDPLSPSICPGDSGAGLTFPAGNRSRHYLIGTVSSVSSARLGSCAAATMNQFAKVEFYGDFIRHHLTPFYWDLFKNGN